MNIEKICQSISKLLEKARAPLVAIPSIILICSAIKRPGLSAMMIASNIIRRQSEAGAPVGPAADGSRNIAEAMEVIRVEELLKAIHLDGKVEIAIPPGGITSVGSGANAGGPVVVTSINTMPVSGSGVFR